ncbi:unnamed protein product [Haemonchus placei]|uniref:Ig-like domain-containing protein n=1 Tax=Haemonchus placei TaxID=6290 RepID=A0A0N4WJK0_HAEPC|nr:unnamed protein product [Haemonchus placei]
MNSAEGNETWLMISLKGGVKIVNIDLDTRHAFHELVTGISLSLTCDELQRKTWQNETDSTILWYLNSEPIRNQRFEWRVTVSTEGVLSEQLLDNIPLIHIWPLMEEDGGHYECSVDGSIMGSALINVKAKSEAVIQGLYNYLYVAVFYIPVAIYAIILTSRDIARPPKKSQREDKMTAFLEQHVLKNGQDVKENIAKIIYGDQFEKRKDEITKSIAAGITPNGEKLRGNHDTIMTLLGNPKSMHVGEVRRRTRVRIIESEKLRGNHDTIMTLLGNPKSMHVGEVKRRTTVKIIECKGVGKNKDLKYQSVMPKVDPTQLDNTLQQDFRHFV